jgi:hypothetical protein
MNTSLGTRDDNMRQLPDLAALFIGKHRLAAIRAFLHGPATRPVFSESENRIVGIPFPRDIET